MPVTCHCCAHLDRAALDEAIITGMPMREVARRWNVSKDGAWRHKAHISPHLAKVIKDRRGSDGAVSALSRLEDLYGRAQRVLGAAEAQGQAGLSLAAIKELRGLVEVLAKITGELDESPKVQVLNVATSDEWLMLRETVMAALAPHPEAAAAVARALAGTSPHEPVTPPALPGEVAS